MELPPLTGDRVVLRPFRCEDVSAVLAYASDAEVTRHLEWDAYDDPALAAAFIPLYSRSLKENTREEARDFAAASVNLLTLILVAITVIGEALLLWLIAFADPNRLSFVLMLKLSAIMLPYVVLICLTAFLSAILQVHRHFAMPAFAPVLLNVIHIVVTVSGGWLLGILATVGAHVRIPVIVMGSQWLMVMLGLAIADLRPPPPPPRVARIARART